MSLCIKLGDLEKKRQVKDLVAYFPLVICKTEGFKLREKQIQT